ncbi:TetR/AcrR family transcriptional regulator [Mucilaginibacter jinjuensis]|uniref:TetR/AcrR family transcriptional regulator n=1 Tax=Mucilaginibacter jinjuensis TaxID=1176721 RepID=A0ABY7T346_9SPHI|nr:TetR/AcrR family transcriptional regulator [Mucilaginibacter jinjuensis]WCT10859.1 TetR/AcrR family transcriptional regulator [Mucilaginibacter jinjuensis]
MRPKNLDKEQAIRSIALQIIAEEGLENLTMQKLAAAAGISPRTIYIKYKDKDDLLVKLYVEEVLGNYETAVLQNFDNEMNFADGVKKLWLNAFGYFKNNRHAFALMQYGKSSPLLNKAYQEMNIKEGDYFAPVMRFLELNVAKGVIKDFPQEVQRALLFAPALDLVNEYFDYLDRPKQIITDEVFMDSCEVVIRGMINR